MTPETPLESVNHGYVITESSVFFAHPHRAQ